MHVKILMGGFPSPTPHTPSLSLITPWASLPVSLDNGIARHMCLRQQHFCLPHNVIAPDVFTKSNSRRSKSALCDSRNTPSRIRFKKSRSGQSFQSLSLRATASFVLCQAPPRLSETPLLAQSLPIETSLRSRALPVLAKSCSINETPLRTTKVC